MTTLEPDPPRVRTVMARSLPLRRKVLGAGAAAAVLGAVGFGAAQAATAPVSHARPAVSATTSDSTETAEPTETETADPTESQTSETSETTKTETAEPTETETAE